MTIAVSGAVLLAAVYHSILYSHRKTGLLKSYSTYLWFTMIYCGYRLFFFGERGGEIEEYLNLDEMLQMIAFIMYIIFAGVAFDLDKQKDRYAYLFTNSIHYVILSYLVLQLIFLHTQLYTAYLISKGIIRLYLMIVGLLLMLTITRKRKNAYYNYLAAGGISMIACGLASSLINFIIPGKLAFGAISWLLLGFFLDVLFFSSAIGYRIRAEYQEKEAALKTLYEKENELQQKELEKINAVYKTREVERQRIARDLHDEVGATLTSISFLSEVVKLQYMNGDPDTTKNLDKIGDYSRKMIEEISDSVWAINPANDSFDRITDRMQNFALPVLASAGMQLDFKSDEKLRPLKLGMEKRKNFYLIFKEALNNAVKYSGSPGLSIHIFSEEDGNLVMDIRDHGKGFDIKRVSNGNGLNNLRTRAAEINATIAVNSSEGKGTQVRLRLPVTQNA